MHLASDARYSNPALLRRCGTTGLQLPLISLGFWHNFGGVDVFEKGRAIVRRAFDLGVFHFDFANNYGPPPGSAEENFGRILRTDFAAYRDELIISTKAGWSMWPGPFGERCSRKSMLASLDQSLGRLGLEYVDIFYAHRWDEQTPLEETMGALAQAVRVGKALYVGVSGYSPEQTTRAAALLRNQGVTPVIHQPRYSMFDRSIEGGLLDALEKEGMGCIPFSPLAQGLLTNRYLHGIPADARAGRSDYKFLQSEHITPAVLAKVQALHELAVARGQSLAGMALAWTLRDPRVTSALIGASKVSQLEDNLAAFEHPNFDAAELARIDTILAG